MLVHETLDAGVIWEDQPYCGDSIDFLTSDWPMQHVSTLPYDMVVFVVRGTSVYRNFDYRLVGPQ